MRNLFIRLGILLGVVVGVVSLALSAEHARLPIEAFVPEASESSFRVSPQGNMVASVVASERACAILIVRVSDGSRVAAIRLPAGHVVRLLWLSESRIVVEQYWEDSILRSSPNIGTFAVGDKELVWIRRADTKLKGGDLNSLRGGWSIVGKISESEEEFLVAGISANWDYHVYRLNAVTGASTVLTPAVRDVAGWLVDGHGIVRVAITIDGDRYRYLYRESNDEKFRDFDKSDFGVTLGYRVRDLLDPHVVLEGVGEPGFIYISDDHGVSRARLSLYDLKSRAVVKTLVSDEVFDVGGLNGNEVSLVRDLSTGNLVGVRYERERACTVWMDDEMAAIQEMVDRSLPAGRVNTLLSWSNDRSVFLIASEDGGAPGEVYICRPFEKFLAVFKTLNPALPVGRMAPSEVVRFAARDGLPLMGYLTVPRGREPRNLPLILMPHGGPWVRDSWGFDPNVQFLASRGYAVLQVNFRGSTGFGHDHFAAGQKEFGTGMINDLVDAVRWAVDQGIVDRNRVGVMGASYGGYASFRLAVSEPELFRVAIPLLSPIDMKQLINEASWGPPNTVSAYWKTLIGNPSFTNGMLRDLDPSRFADRLKAPVLAFFGERDPIVPISQMREAKAMLREAKVPHEVIVYPGEGHGFRKRINRIDMYRRIEAFLAKYLPAD